MSTVWKQTTAHRSAPWPQSEPPDTRIPVGSQPPMRTMRRINPARIGVLKCATPRTMGDVQCLTAVAVTFVRNATPLHTKLGTAMYFKQHAPPRKVEALKSRRTKLRHSCSPQWDALRISHYHDHLSYTQHYWQVQFILGTHSA